MRSIIKSLIASIFLLSPVLSFGAWTGYYPVKTVYAHQSGMIYVKLDPDTSHSNPSGCTSTVWLAVPSTHANKKEIHQLLLTAQAAGMKVQLGVDGCQGSYPKVLHAMSQN